MPKNPPLTRDDLAVAIYQYAATLPGSPAEAFLRARGLPDTEIKGFHLGYVAYPYSELHRRYKGWLSIPILTGDLQPYGMRFRRLEGEGEKYLSMRGSASRLFAVHYVDADDVCITEGELDAVTLHHCGLKAVGVPGANAWNENTGKVWRWLFRNCSTVRILFDNDKAGNAGAEHVRRSLRDIVRGDVIRVSPPPGMDVNDWYLSLGAPVVLKETILRGEE